MIQLTRLRPPCVSLSSLNLGLQLHHQTRSITAWGCISEFTQSRSPIASPNWIDHGLKVHLQTRSNTASQCISEFTQSWSPTGSQNSLDHGLKVHLQTRSITASQCISEFTQSRSPIVSPNSLDHGLRVYLCVHLIVIFRRTSNCSQSPCAASPDIPCVDRLLYRYIDALMRTQTEWISFENRWTISSSYDFQAHQQHSQTRCFSQTTLQRRYVCNETSRLGNRKRVILPRRVWGCVRAIRAVLNTQVFLT